MSDEINNWFVSGSIAAVIVIFPIVVWIVAHSTIATECRKLGAFYVGETVFDCKVREGK